MSTAYLPPVEYFYYLMKYKKVRIEQFESYAKQTYRNRCEIYSEKGKMSLSVPVSRVFGNNTKSKDIQLFNNDRWFLNHWRAIEAAYLASPFFLYYRDEFEPYFRGDNKNLLDFNLALTKLICQLINLEVNFTFSEDYEKIPTDVLDLRFEITPKKSATINHFPEYIQVFNERHGFIPNLSIIDVLFNLGPETKSYLVSLS